MASGLGLDPQCLEETNALVKGRKYRAIVLRINDKMTSVEVERVLPTVPGSVKAAYMELTKSLPANDCRFFIYDFEFEMQGITKNKVVFILWSPEYSKVRSKMIYAASQEGVLTALDGISRQMQATDLDELSYDYVAAHLRQHTAGY
uniref:ADF-H domain-containing protein n=1 Tax=Compsopogon caeruleus TaxID=31354 RepID=A0A7S1TF15_9RHOD|mmetsp:Transcript_3244/g.6110  ORF Transcript_3244/g.6110 Transcript_3244/m.6110 type:complete len:147 (+) Transcript_3244:358-798(+)|eukprot:CAMPEP_0184683794 /NCGR_PEP_ID=MMETSP0312-20130426/12609_1 /TAXON_ID=31354 /ORGANISM="Compsopogon coeruleus, Strain SAG 36.94" /LENGTH=146 /DNA_ID=CAMNT_0027136403 /DNA_START=345 /DNA_END=785 /DNA_ORIENTATION=+